MSYYKKDKIMKKPKPIKSIEIDWSDVIEICEQYINEIFHKELDEDTENFIFEAALKAVYGNDIFNYVNYKI